MPNQTFTHSRAFFLCFLLGLIALNTNAQLSWAPPSVDSEPNTILLRPISGAEPAFWYLPDVLGTGPALYTDVAPDGYTLAESQSCVAQIVTYDPYCLDTGWDDLCEDEYLCCVSEDEQFRVGCTNASACNYDPTVCASQPSTCVYCIGNCYSLSMFDSYGDGWNGATWSFTDDAGVVVASGTMADGFSSLAADCIDDGCYTFEVSDGVFPEEISWTLTGGDLGDISGGANTSTTVTFNGATGCTSQIACNYDEEACADDGSCVHLNDEVTDMTSSSWELFWDFGCSGNPAQATLYFNGDMTVSDNEGGSAEWSLCGEVISLAFDGVLGYQGTWDGLGFVGEIVYPEAGCFELYPTSLGCTDVTACNYDSEATVFDGSCTYPGCMNPLGCNYDALAGCEGPCDFPEGYLLGCTNPASTNYDASATVDDGSCDLSYLCLEGTVYDESLMGCVPIGCPGDMNQDGAINVNDLLEFLIVYDTVCE